MADDRPVTPEATGRSSGLATFSSQSIRNWPTVWRCDLRAKAELGAAFQSASFCLPRPVSARRPLYARRPRDRSGLPSFRAACLYCDGIGRPHRVRGVWSFVSPDFVAPAYAHYRHIERRRLDIGRKTRELIWFAERTDTNYTAGAVCHPQGRSEPEEPRLSGLDTSVGQSPQCAAQMLKEMSWAAENRGNLGQVEFAPSCCHQNVCASFCEPTSSPIFGSTALAAGPLGAAGIRRSQAKTRLSAVLGKVP